MSTLILRDSNTSTFYNSYIMLAKFKRKLLLLFSLAKREDSYRSLCSIQVCGTYSVDLNSSRLMGAYYNHNASDIECQIRESKQHSQCFHCISYALLSRSSLNITHRTAKTTQTNRNALSKLVRSDKTLYYQQPVCILSNKEVFFK